MRVLQLLHRVVFFTTLALVSGLCRTEASASSPAVLSHESRWAHEVCAVAPSPRVTWGRLENGLRYAILPNQTPAGHLSLRLLVHAGSLHEQDDQLGYAHYLEHMAFNGTRRFPSGELIKILQRSGADFGPHVNAFTTHDHTYYLVNFPETSPEKLATGLAILRDYADGILLDPLEVERERGVILSEESTRRTPDQTYQEKIAAQEYKGSRIPLRSPIGTTASIKATNATGLRLFYDTWYRPERMTLLVVGDITVAEARAALEKEFTTLNARSPSPADPLIGTIPTTSEEQISVLTHSVSGVNFAFKSTRSEPAPTYGPDTTKRSLAAHFAIEMFKQRLTRLTDHQSTRIFSGSHLDASRPWNQFRTVQLYVNGSQFLWEKVLATGEQELRRVLQHGFLEEELDPTRAQFLTTWSQYAALSPRTPSPELMNALHRSIAGNDPFLQPEDYLPIAHAIVPQITAADCHAAFVRAWGDSNHHLFVTRYGDSPTAAEVRRALATSRKTAVAAPAPVAKVDFVYQNFGPPGAVAFKQHIPDLDLWLVQFANGVRLNLKPTRTQPGLALYTLRFGPGMIDEPATKPGLRFWLPGLLYGGLGLHNYDDIQKLLRERGLSNIHLQCLPDTSLVSGYCAQADIPFHTQLLTALLTDPAYSYTSRDRVLAELTTQYDSMLGTQAIAQAAYVNPFLYNQDLRFCLPARETHSSYTLDDLRDWLEPYLKDGRLEFAIVGDIDIPSTIQQVAQTLGTLKPRKTSATPQATTNPKLPETPRSLLYAFPSAKNSSSTLSFYWPIRQTLDMRTRRQLDLLASILNDRIRIQIRETLGATYTTQTQLAYHETLPTLSHLLTQFEAKPDQAQKISDLVSRLAATLAKDGPNDDELDRARQPLLAQAKQAPLENQYWLYAVLTDAQLHRERLAQARSLSSDYLNTSRQDLTHLARLYLKPENLLRFILNPENPSPAASAATKRK